MIYSYKKYVDKITTKELRLPIDAQTRESIGTELCTIDGLTYVFIPDEITLPVEQPNEIVDSVRVVTLTDELREQIKQVSPHVKLIASRMQDRIREKYSIEDEMYFARIGAGAANGFYTPADSEFQAMKEFGNFVESVRQQGRTERAKLGL